MAEFRIAETDLADDPPLNLERLGIDVLAMTTPLQDNLNNTQFPLTSIRVRTTLHENRYAWVITTDENSYPFHKWPSLAPLARWMDEIIVRAKAEGVALLIPVEIVTFNYEFMSDNPLSQQEPIGAKSFRKWLIDNYGFVQIGQTPNGYADLLVIDPTPKPPISYRGLPKELRELIDGVEARLEQDGDLEWLDRAARKLIAALRSKPNSTKGT